ncbi:hypothetical protein G7K_3730-t1 [Saitoella complicata NRRL Y-17804]|uniref:Uncharacterized protein n=1 Tax=Saitoella complicata (strain BCRC 22490 / CBS 7301 / JCM 7358 / NBRC 10748 / NRRL Y-17804) TaxID=698492 RepID=A0A0E9NIS6_SAICN|nr:hypothetical protein G7K_3730-t1 [Saitoella complicata NRRL Y-17804]
MSSVTDPEPRVSTNPTHNPFFSGLSESSKNISAYLLFPMPLETYSSILLSYLPCLVQGPILPLSYLLTYFYSLYFVSLSSSFFFLKKSILFYYFICPVSYRAQFFFFFFFLFL